LQIRNELAGFRDLWGRVVFVGFLRRHFAEIEVRRILGWVDGCQREWVEHG
jgi:hypothetical protein